MSSATQAALDPATYQRHALHGDDRIWGETNCYADLWIELLHGLGFEPHAMLPFTVAIDFEGDQWTFFKPPHADLAALYGLEVQELNLWRPLLDHVVEQVGMGRPVLVELDSWYLPDTSGSAYRLQHTKTTVGVHAIDPARGTMDYFHNAGFFRVEGEDFDELFHRNGLPHARVLPPYVEIVKRTEVKPPRDGALAWVSAGLLQEHIARAPRDNPFGRFRERFARDLDWLMSADMAQFHAYSFATLRQYGANFELAKSSLEWLAGHEVANHREAAEAFGEIAQTAKAFQFQLARAISRKKPLDLSPIDAMGAQWERAMLDLRRSRN